MVNILKLSEKDFNTKIGKHYKLREFVRNRECCLPKTFKEIVSMIHLTTNVLDKVRDHFNSATIITSGRRCKKCNDAAGSTDNSQHRKAEAADIKVIGVNMKTVFKWMVDNLDYDQIIYESRKDSNGNLIEWIHVSYKIEGNRKSTLISLEPGLYELYRRQF